MQLQILVLLLALLNVSAFVSFTRLPHMSPMMKRLSRPNALTAPSGVEWKLKSFSYDQLFGICSTLIREQSEDIKPESVVPSATLTDDFELDSVDKVAILLKFESSFKASSGDLKMTVPTSNLGSIATMNDLVLFLQTVLSDVEKTLAEGTTLTTTVSL